MAAALLLAALGGSWLVLGTRILASGGAGVVLFGVVLALALLVRSVHLDDRRWFVACWAALGGAVAVYSVLTGWFNGLTDEPAAMPAFAQLLPNLYGSAINVSYTQYGGAAHQLTSAYIYLPLLVLLQLPGVDYRWIAVATWLATVYLLRARPLGVVVMANPLVGLVAASGFNDFPTLLVVTLSLVSLTGRPARVAEVVGLGLKQFANVVFVAYYAWQRRWKDVLVVGLVTAALLAPFAYLAPHGALCHAILLNPSPTCAAGGTQSTFASVASHLNYYVWPLWILAAFGGSYVASLKGPAYAEERRTAARWAGARSDAPVSAWTLLLVPIARLRQYLTRAPPKSGRSTE